MYVSVGVRPYKQLKCASAALSAVEQHWESGWRGRGLVPGKDEPKHCWLGRGRRSDWWELRLGVAEREGRACRHSVVSGFLTLLHCSESTSIFRTRSPGKHTGLLSGQTWLSVFSLSVLPLVLLVLCLFYFLR